MYYLSSVHTILPPLSASACAREDRHVGGTRWADASYIQSDAKSIGILLLVWHRVIWDPGSLVERIAICAHAESPLFEITLPHAARESAHVVVSPEQPPNNQFVPSLPSPIDMLVGYLHFVCVYYPSSRTC